jgi:hypothetical protein
MDSAVVGQTDEAPDFAPDFPQAEGWWKGKISSAFPLMVSRRVSVQDGDAVSARSRAFGAGREIQSGRTGTPRIEQR